MARLGKKMSEETRAKHRRENLPPETRIKLSKGHTRIKSMEERAAISKGLSGVPKSKEHRKKLAGANQGRHFYNNGISEIYILCNPPEGFVKGRLPAYKERLKGSKNPNAGNCKWTNGKVEVQSKTCPGEGFVRGKLSSYEPFIDLFS